MHNMPGLFLILGAVWVAGWALFGLIWMYQFRSYIKDVQTCGYLPPPPDERGQRRIERLSGFFVWLFVGKVEVVGLRNLDKLPGGSGIITPNHPSCYDIVIIPHVIARKARYMAARGVMRAFCGAGALLCGPVGAFACDLDRGKGLPALLAAVRVLVSGQLLVMWPEGWTYLDGVMRDFKKGAVKIARKAQEELGEPVYLVPCNIEYGKYPGKWMLSLPIQMQYLVLVMLFPLFRRGARVVFDEPIALNEMPADDLNATRELQERVSRLQFQTEASHQTWWRPQPPSRAGDFGSIGLRERRNAQRLRSRSRGSASR